MNYNPNDKANVRQSMLVAMNELNGYNATVRLLNNQLKTNPSASANINADKAYLKHKCAASGKQKIKNPPPEIKEEPQIENPMIPPPKKLKKINPVIENEIIPTAQVESEEKPSKIKSKRIGTKEQVYFGEAEKTSGGLKKEDLIINKQNKIISKKKSEYGQKFAAERLKKYQADKKLNAAAPPELKGNEEEVPEEPIEE